VSAIGCCAQTTLFSCQDGKLLVDDCTAQDGPKCGWNPDSGGYACGFSGADPAGEWPLACDLAPPADVVVDVPLPGTCQRIEFPGCCDGQTVRWCDGMGLHAMDCSANPPPLDKCGWNGSKGYYDCGGSGSDPTGQYPHYCPAVDVDVVSDAGTGPQCKLGTLIAVGCGDVTWEGCCGQGAALYFCEGGKYLCSLECGKLQPPNNVCGWLAAGGYYDCGGQGADPSNEHPETCAGLPVQEDAMAPDESSPVPACADVPAGGCCDGSLLNWCEDGTPRAFDCVSLAADPVFSAYVYCGTNPVTKKVDCIKKPDPAAPVCGAPLKPEPPEDVVQAEPHAELQVEPADLGTPEKAESLADAGPRKDSSVLVIPTEAGLEEEKKKPGGCNAGAGTAWWLLLLTLAPLLRRRRCP